MAKWGMAVLVLGALLPLAVSAQQVPMAGGQTPHAHIMAQPAVGRIPTSPGQDAFGAIQEIVRILEADPATDWSTVNLERLRQHLVDMNEVTLQSSVRTSQIVGGLAMEVTGTGRTEAAIRRMVVPHAGELNKMPERTAETEAIPGGVRLVVTAKSPEDARTVARIRGLGFIGLLTEGAHHQLHHLAMAKGEELFGHGH
jgi:hypothetical protein